MSEYVISWNFAYYTRKGKKQKSIYKEQSLFNFSNKEALWTYLGDDGDGHNNDRSLNDLV